MQSEFTTMPKSMLPEMKIKDYANQEMPSARLGRLEEFFSEKDERRAIDFFQEAVDAIVSYGTVERLDENDFLGRLLMLGLVSATEGYVRRILSNCIEICPVARSKAASKMINLGGMLWHGKDGFSKSAFEHMSFASTDEIIKSFREFIDFKMEDGTFKSIFEQYEIVCHLRHGVVHGDGFLPGRNAVQLDIPKYRKPTMIIIRYAQLQEIALVVTTLVMTINRALFDEMCKRWAINWRARADWVGSDGEKRLKQIWQIFHSEKDRRRQINKSTINYRACRLAILTQYAIE